LLFKNKLLLNKQRIYFDNAATTPVHEEVVKVMADSLRNIYGNPSSTHYSGRDAKAQLEESRRKIAKILKCKPGEILFTSCGTESNNAVLHHAVHQIGVQRILTTAIEHPAIYNALKQYEEKVEIKFLQLNSDGTVNLDNLKLELESNNCKTFVTIMHANNEMGALNDIQKIAEVCKSFQDTYIHSDMVQTVGHLPVSFAVIPLDFASASAHKFHGAKGVGFLFVRQPNQLLPLITGGSQERGFRSGTENLSAIAGMAKALELATSDLESDIKHLNALRSSMRSLLKTKIPQIKFLTSEENSLCTVLSVVFPPEFDKEMLLFQLDMKGIACSGGSACSSGANKASHVLAQFHIPAECKVVRFSFSKFNNLDEIALCVDRIAEVLSESVAQ
jgi:cysteine desulfurase